MKDIVSIATAASDFAADNGEWDISQSGDINSGSEFVLAITPFHIKICPVVDHWGQPYKVYLGAQAAVRGITADDIGLEDFVIASHGRDGISDAWTWEASTPDDDFYTVDGFPAFRHDLINWNGSWIRAPRVAVPSGTRRRPLSHLFLLGEDWAEGTILSVRMRNTTSNT